MKKILTMLVLATSVASVSHAQLQQGNVFMGADLANVDLGLKKGDASSISLVPRAAWFVRDNFAVGAYVKFGLVTAKDQGSDVTYGVGPLARYYFNNEKVNLLQHGRWFVEGTAGIEGENVSDGDGHSDHTNGLGLGIGPGYAYFITPNIGLETLLKYNGVVGFGNATTTSRLGLSIGFQVYLPGKATRDKIMRDERK